MGDPYQYPQQSAPYGAPVMAARPASTSGWAIASLILSIVGVSLLGVIFGHVALSQIKKSNGMVGGRGLAIAGLIIGYLGIAVALILVGFVVLAVLTASNGATTTWLAPIFG